MGRAPRLAIGGLVYHVLNRAAGRRLLFRKRGDFAAMEGLIAEAKERVPLRILAYSLMPTHWHLVLWPEESHDDALGAFVHWMSMTHARRWHLHRRTSGTGHVYQGRFKSFPVQDDAHFLTLCRYVERNALRAKLVDRAVEWRWSSLWVRQSGTSRQREILSEWPLPPGDDWPDFVQQPVSRSEMVALRRSVRKGRPYGDPDWVELTAERLGLRCTLRSVGRPSIP